MARTARKEAKVKNQSQDPNPSKDVVCWHCGKKGHLRSECWSNPKNQSGSGGTQNKGGKGKPKDVTGRRAGSLEQGEQAAVVEPQPQPALASSLDLASVETLVRPPHLYPEGWLRWTYDTGEATSAFPLDAKIRKETQAKECSTKTPQVNKFPTVVACAYKEPLSTSMERFSTARRQTSTKLWSAQAKSTVRAMTPSRLVI